MTTVLTPVETEKVNAAIADRDCDQIIEIAADLEDENRPDDAELVLAVASDAGYVEATHNLALLLANRGAEDEAIALYRRALALRSQPSTSGCCLKIEARWRTLRATILGAVPAATGKQG